jgi:thiol-disulfide isomerase/thioredoxin
VNRRQAWAGGAIGLGAAMLGGAVGWQRLRPTDEQMPPEFWNQRLERPEGGEIALADWRGSAWLLNCWATWCAPCVRELPVLDRFAQDFEARGWRVMALAIDTPQAVRAFMQKLPLKMPVALAGSAGFDWLRMLGNSKGALPYSVAFRPGGEIRWRKIGESSYSELVSLAKTA